MLTNILYAIPYQNSAREAIDSGDYGKAFSVIESIPCGTSDGEEIQRLAVKNQLYGLLVSNILNSEQQSEEESIRKIGVPKALEHLALIGDAIGIKSEHNANDIEDKFKEVQYFLEVLAKREIEDSDTLRMRLDEYDAYALLGSSDEIEEIVESHKKTQEALKVIR